MASRLGSEPAVGRLLDFAFLLKRLPEDLSYDHRLLYEIQNKSRQRRYTISDWLKHFIRITLHPSFEFFFLLYHAVLMNTTLTPSYVFNAHTHAYEGASA